MKLNNQVAPADDIHVRRAIPLATDYDLIRDVIYPGSELSGRVAPVFPDAIPEGTEPATYDLEAARAELEQSAYFGDGPISLDHVCVSGTAFEKESALLLKSSLDSIGFDVTITPEPRNRITELATSIETTPHTTQVSCGTTYPSPDSVVYFVQCHIDTAGTWLSMDWVLDGEVDAMIESSRRETDPDARDAIYRDIFFRPVEDQRSGWMLAKEKRLAANECLQGCEQIPMQSWDLDFSRMDWSCAE